MIIDNVVYGVDIVIGIKMISILESVAIDKSGVKCESKTQNLEILKRELARLKIQISIWSLTVDNGIVLERRVSYVKKNKVSCNKSFLKGEE